MADGTRILRELRSTLHKFEEFPGPERSAQTLAHLACSPALDQSSGRYYHLGTETEKDPRAHDPELAGRLWDEAERAVAAAAGN